MDTARILSELRVEMDRIQKAIDALEALDATAVKTHPVQQAQAAPKGRGGRRTMSAAARRRISEAAKRRWAQQKSGTTKPQASVKQTAPKPTATKPRITAAGRKRISEMMKKRWAVRKAAAKA